MGTTDSAEIVAPNQPDKPLEKAPKSQSRHIPYLDGLRGLAALWVMIGHARVEALSTHLTGKYWPKLLGYIHEGWAVPVFIVLSGFLLATPLVDHSREKWRGAWQFMVRRARRIYPAYLAAIVLGLILINVFPYWSSLATPRWKDAIPVTGKDLGLHLLLLHNWFPGYIHKIDPPMWSLAIEWQIYILFAVVLVPILFAKGWKAFVIAGAIISAICFLKDKEFALLLACFVVGAVSSKLSYSEVAIAQKIRSFAAIPYIAGALFIGAYIVFNRGIIADAFTGTASALVLIYLCRPSKESRILAGLRSFLASRPARMLGWFSYSLYLIHFFILSGINSAAIAAQVDPRLRTILVLLVAPLLSLAVAFGFAWLFEYRWTAKGVRSPVLPA
jgi:peptidoglycan/LPS O-acetylase OafA/YrhL